MNYLRVNKDYLSIYPAGYNIILRFKNSSLYSFNQGHYTYSCVTGPTRLGGYLGKFVQGMCRWPLRAPAPVGIFYFVASYRPHLSHFWENVILWFQKCKVVQADC